MTMPHLMNCNHSEDWCLSCVKKLHDEKEQIETERNAMREALRSARLGAKLRGITTREFAAMCAITPTQLSAWTSDIPNRHPDIC